MAKWNVTVFGKRLLELRESHEETQEQLARAIGVKREQITYWESAIRESIKTQHLVNIANHYNTTTDFLLGLSETTSRDESVQIASRVMGLSDSALDSIQAMTAQGRRDLSELLSCETFVTMVSNLESLRESKAWIIKNKGIFDDYGGINGAVRAEEKLQENYEYYLTIPKNLFGNLYESFAELRLQLYEMAEKWSDVLEKVVPTEDLISDTKELISDGKRLIWGK